MNTVCSDTWEDYGQPFFTNTCTGCHVHDHANFATQSVVQGEGSLIVDRVNAGLMPQGATLASDERARLVQFVNCGAPSRSSDAGYPFEAESPQTALAKVKNILVGLPPTADEYHAVERDPQALSGLVAGWQMTPEYEAKMKLFFELAFQQTQITQADFVDLIPPQGLGLGAAVPLVVQNARESFARTVLALGAEGRPFTDAFTTHRLMMTPALMELYAFLDTRRVDNAGKVTDPMPRQYPNFKITLQNDAGMVPLEQSLDPTSPNFMHWYDPDVGHLTYPDPTCNTDPITMPVQAYSIHYLLYGAVAGHAGPSTNCAQRGGTAAGVQFAATDFTDWRMVTLRPPAPGEAISRFYDLPTLRSAQELVIETPRAGFFSTPAFFANWPTNQSNQMRVTLNQALIVALGTAVDGLDPTSSPLTPGIDETHAANTDCFACHRILDPTRSIFSSTWSWFYYPQKDTGLIAEKGRFIFQGVNQPVSDLDQFAQLLATHPKVAAAWTQKLCTYANSAPCDVNDPQFIRVATAFSASNFSWAGLVKDLMSSPLVTHLSATATAASTGDVIAVTRRDHLCAALNARLGLVDACGLSISPGKKPGTGTIPQIVSGLPSDGYGRGATEPVLPNAPTLFYRAAIENICVQAATLLIDAPVNANQPTAKHWVSTDSDTAINDFVTTLVGLSPADPRSTGVTALLKAHFVDASKTQSKTNALRSTFVSACLSPTFIGVGM